MSAAQGYLEGLVPIIGREAVLEVLESSEHDASTIIARMQDEANTSLPLLKEHLHALKGIALNLGLDASGRALADASQHSLPEAILLKKKIPELLAKELGEIRQRLQS